MRQFDGLLFMGMGEFSAAGERALKRRLASGLSLSSGIQQGGDTEYEADLEDVVRDIGAALLGRDITIGAKLPYPPTKPEYVRRGTKVTAC